MKGNFLDVEKKYFFTWLFWQNVIQLKMLRELSKLFSSAQVQAREDQKTIWLQVAAILHQIKVNQVKKV